MPNLVGIGNSQVPTNAMLGGLAYQDSVGEIDIDKIKQKHLVQQQMYLYMTHERTLMVVHGDTVHKKLLGIMRP